MCTLQWHKTVQYFYTQKSPGLHKRSNKYRLLNVTNKQKCQQKINVYLSFITNINYHLNGKANNTEHTKLIHLICNPPNTCLSLSKK